MSTLSYPKNPEAVAWLGTVHNDDNRTDQEREAARLLLPIAGPARNKESFFFRHVDGGIYYFLGEVKHANDDSPHIVYEHLWPFDRERRVRPKPEWERRFTRIDPDEFLTALEGDRAEAQVAVMQAKAKRREQEARDKQEDGKRRDARGHVLHGCERCDGEDECTCGPASGGAEIKP